MMYNAIHQYTTIERAKNMTNTKLLKEVVKASGLKKKFIAEQIGASYRSYLNKENGITGFFADELCVMVRLLNLSEQEMMNIFFAP